MSAAQVEAQAGEDLRDWPECHQGADIPGCRPVGLGLPDSLYERYGPGVDRICSFFIDQLAAAGVTGLVEPDGTFAGDFLPASHIVMAAVDHAVWYALTDIARSVFGQSLEYHLGPPRLVEGDGAWHYAGSSADG